MAPGLFGKLPAHGDFINRGLSGPLRRALDHWVTHHIGQQALPAGGLRARLTLAGTPTLMVIVQSRDKHARVFPVMAITADTGQTHACVDQWCDLTAEILGEAISDGTTADTLTQTLPPAPNGTTVDAPQKDVIWAQGQAPQPSDTALANLAP